MAEVSTSRGICFGQLPYGLRIREISDQTTGGSKSKNIVALGYLAGLLGIKQSLSTR